MNLFSDLFLLDEEGGLIGCIIFCFVCYIVERFYLISSLTNALCLSNNEIKMQTPNPDSKVTPPSDSFSNSEGILSLSPLCSGQIGINFPPVHPQGLPEPDSTFSPISPGGTPPSTAGLHEPLLGGPPKLCCPAIEPPPLSNSPAFAVHAFHWGGSPTFAGPPQTPAAWAGNQTPCKSFLSEDNVLGWGCMVAEGLILTNQIVSTFAHICLWGWKTARNVPHMYSGKLS